MDFDAQQFSEQGLQVLTVSNGPVVVSAASTAGFSRSRSAAIARADVEVSIQRTEVQLAAVVAARGLNQFQHFEPSVWIGLCSIGIGAEAEEAFVDEGAGAIGPVAVVNDIKKAILFKIRVEYEVVEALLTHDTVVHDVQTRRAEVQKGLVTYDIIGLIIPHDQAAVADDEQIGFARRMGCRPNGNRPFGGNQSISDNRCGCSLSPPGQCTKREKNQKRGMSAKTKGTVTGHQFELQANFAKDTIRCPSSAEHTLP